MAIQHNNTKITCLSSCCVPKVNQINGAQGEATNTDDLKKTDRAQNKRIQNLEKRLRALVVTKKKGGKKGQTKKRISKRPRGRAENNPFPGIPAPSQLDVQPPVVHKDPTVLSAVAQLAPFRVPRGVCNILTNAKPSQKFTARALLSFTVAANTECLQLITPCVASDANGASLINIYGTRANLYNQTLASTTYASGITGAGVSTNTPYTASALAGNDYQWRLVSAGLRVRNTTAAVNRQGIIKWIVDHDSNVADFTQDATSYGAIADRIDSNHRTVRKNMANTPDCDVVVSGQLFDSAIGNTTWRSASTGQDVSSSIAFYPLSVVDYVRPLASTSLRFAIGGGFVLYPSVPSAQSYDCELIEHWEVCGTAIETLHTPSGSHGMAAQTLHAVLTQAHHQHSQTPSLALHDVAKGVSFAEHHKAALKDAASVGMALAML